MLDGDQAIYYLSYGLLCLVLGVVFIRIRSSEGVVITTKEFKIFQTSFVAAYSTVMLCELISNASFYHTFVYLKLPLEQVTRLYVVTVTSSTVFAFVAEVVDVGSRKNKSMISVLLFALSMLMVLVSAGHYHLLLLARVVFGAGEALYRSSFEAYAIHEHTNRGFPEDWLTNTFTNLTHSLALVAAASGVVGQSVASGGPLGPVGLCFALHLVSAAYISVSWTKDTNSAKFSLSGFLFNASQLMNSVKNSRATLLVLLISVGMEAAITIFTFFWAPWIATLVTEGTGGGKVPFEIVYSVYVSISMLGNYLYQLFGQTVGADALFGGILTAATGAFILGAMSQTSSMAFFISLIIQLCIGCYWPCIGLLRGRILLPELRTAALTITRIVTAAVSLAVLSSVHNSPLLTMAACASLTGLAAFCQTTLTQIEPKQEFEDEVLEEDA